MVNTERKKIREFIGVEFEPDVGAPLRHDIFNLHFGMKIEIMHNIVKSEKQGVRKGFMFGTLLGHGVFGHETYI